MPKLTAEQLTELEAASRCAPTAAARDAIAAAMNRIAELEAVEAATTQTMATSSIPPVEAVQSRRSHA